jgi:hypothetical protein
MPKRFCIDCGAVFDKASNPGKQRCKPCQVKNGRARDKRRGSASARGYGSAHARKAKAVIADAIARNIGCCYCGGSPTEADPFVGCHVYAQSRGGPKDGPLAAGHRSCNNRAAGKLNRKR